MGLAGVHFFAGRPYDADSGRWMSVSREAATTPPDPFEPESVDLLAFNLAQPRPVHLLAGLSCPATWLRRVGLRLDNLIPLLRSQAVVSPALAFPDPFWAAGIHEAIHRKLAFFQQLLTQTPSAILPPSPQPRPPALLSPAPATFGEGTLLANLSGRAVLYDALMESQDPFEANSLHILLNNTRIIPLLPLLRGPRRRRGPLLLEAGQPAGGPGRPGAQGRRSAPHAKPQTRPPRRRRPPSRLPRRPLHHRLRRLLPGSPWDPF